MQGTREVVLQNSGFLYVNENKTQWCRCIRNIRRGHKEKNKIMGRHILVYAVRLDIGVGWVA
jgi:hypothetical protein